MKKRIAALLMTIIILSSVPSPAGAPNGPIHAHDMLHVLFGKNFKEENCSDKELRAIEALKAACYLAIDQFNGKGEEQLKTLSDYHVSSLPSSISEIDFRGNEYHRRYTHRGWCGPYNNDEKPYQDDKAHWNTRKNILIQTTKKIFGFNENQHQLSDSLSAVIYYVHILGDHIAETDYYKRNSDLIGGGGRNDEYDIIHQLIYHFDILFTSVSNTYQYISFIDQMELLNDRFSALVNKEGGVNSAEKQADYSALAEELMNLLINHVPELLQEESYFSNVFPPR